jgi:predicted nucleic-acid-binding protein
MRGLDTNVLVRYLTEDDPEQSRKAGKVLEETAAKGERCFLGSVVLCELVWVLEGPYDLKKKDVVLALEKLLGTVEFSIEEMDLVRRALDDYRLGPGDFADYLIGWRNRKSGCRETVTFDAHLKGCDRFRVL